MKKFLFPTDFSANARHALNYGFHLAKQLQANIIICNAIIVPAEVLQADVVSSPMEGVDMLSKDSLHGLDQLKDELESNENNTSFSPFITCVSEVGRVSELVNALTIRYKPELIVMATHSNGGFGTLLLGNHSRKLIDEAHIPLLLVPPSAKLLTLKKIAFATDFKCPVEDMEHIHVIVNLAKLLDAEIVVTNIFDDDPIDISKFMEELVNQADYSRIYYSPVKARRSVSGLDWLCEHGRVDMLVMVHRNHTFIDSLFRGSQTQQMVDHIAVPLLVFPEHR